MSGVFCPQLEDPAVLLLATRSVPFFQTNQRWDVKYDFKPGIPNNWFSLGLNVTLQLKRKKKIPLLFLLPIKTMLPKVAQVYGYLLAWTESRDVANQLWVILAGNQRLGLFLRERCYPTNSRWVQGTKWARYSADSCSEWLNLSRLAISGLMNWISASEPGKHGFSLGSQQLPLLLLLWPIHYSKRGKQQRWLLGFGRIASTVQ